MKKKKIIITIVIIVIIGLLVAGGVLLYQNYSNKHRIITSFEELKAALTETLDITENTNNNSNNSNEQTITGNTTFYINPLFGNSEDGSDVVIGNLNNSTFNYEYRLDTESKRMYMDGSLLLNATELLGINFYQAEDISYIFLKNIFDKYITVEDNDIFKYLEESEKAADDINYIYSKITTSISDNVNSNDIKVTNVDGKKKISLELDGKRLNEISKNIVKDLKKDDKAREILGNSLDELDTTTSSSASDNNNYLNYSIYLEKNNIVTYEFGVNESGTNYSIEFNNGSEKSFVIKEGNTETFKAIITNNNDTLTIDLSSNNISLGTITLNKNNINFNMLLDELTNTAITANITSNTSNNTTTTTFNVSLTANNDSMDVLTITDTKQVLENTADFTDIDTTNSININDLTEEDITTIQNNLTTIFYNIMGFTM